MTSPGVQREARLLAEALSGRLAEIPSGSRTFVTISSITGGVFFSWRGGTYKAAAVNVAYTPAVNDRVLLEMVDDQPTIIGHFA